MATDRTHRPDDWADRLKRVEEGLETHKIECAAAKAKPLEVSKLMFTAPVVWTIVTVVALLIGGMTASTWGLRADAAATSSDVRNILTRMDAQKEVDRVTTKAVEDREAARAKLDEANAKLQERVVTTLSAAVEDFKKAQEMQRVQIESLSKTVLTQQQRR